MVEVSRRGPGLTPKALSLFDFRLRVLKDLKTIYGTSQISFPPSRVSQPQERAQRCQLFCPSLISNDELDSV